ncbi:unnamed protein product [Paramecium pentaurelia]|uniref:Uncharacterized protein n=1 Tax=Paramecium pentaurelia TaxID=43138 RepID=A0A8S1VTY8_9CILI|nr:unnamed protein product [Paramecium pentaurelia]
MVIILELIVIGGCCQPQDKINKSIIRGGYTNVLNLSNGALISSRQMNYYPEGQIQSLCLRDSIYNVNGHKGFWACLIGRSIIIDLFQTYELNTLKLRVWDLEFARWYNLEVYIIYNNIKKLIFQQLAQRVITIQFEDQYVEQIEIFNRSGNTVHSALDIIKIEAFYQIRNQK